MFRTEGKLDYWSSENGYRLVVLVDEEIGRYYRSQIPKHIKINVPRYPMHVTVLRNEIPIDLAQWAVHQNNSVFLQVFPYQYNDDTYWWLRVSCDTLKAIRKRLGLNEVSKWTMPLDEVDFFHITIGNTKNVY